MSQLLSFENLRNTRDLGGMTTTAGRKIRSGRLLRSGHLADATQRDIVALADMIDTVVDFRTPQEIAEKPDPAIEQVRFYHIPILDSLKAGVTREEESDEYAIEKLIQDTEKAKRYMCGIYVDFVSSECAVARYEKFVRLLLEEHPKAVLWHCTAGKDRAGFASVIVQELLGVDKAAIREDYLKTNDYLARDVAELMNLFRTMSGEENPEAEQAMKYLFGAQEEFLDALYDKVDALYGGFDGFIADGLHITPDERDFLKNKYLCE